MCFYILAHNKACKCFTDFLFVCSVSTFTRYKVENPYREFKKACGAIAAHFDEKNNTLSVICDKESSAKRATFISEMHFKNLRQKATLLKRKEEIAQQIEV